MQVLGIPQTIFEGILLGARWPSRSISSLSHRHDEKYTANSTHVTRPIYARGQKCYWLCTSTCLVPGPAQFYKNDRHPQKHSLPWLRQHQLTQTCRALRSIILDIGSRVFRPRNVCDRRSEVLGIAKCTASEKKKTIVSRKMRATDDAMIARISGKSQFLTGAVAKYDNMDRRCHKKHKLESLGWFF